MAHKTKECKLLLRELLKYDANYRISAEEAMKNKWFQLQSIQTKVDSNVVTDCFWNFRNVKVLALSILLSYLT